MCHDLRHAFTTLTTAGNYHLLAGNASLTETGLSILFEIKGVMQKVGGFK